MKRLKIGLLVAVTIAACQGKPAPGRESAAMQDMKGMPGMPAASPNRLACRSNVRRRSDSAHIRPRE